MPRKSLRQELYEELDYVALKIVDLRWKNTIAYFNDDLDDEFSSDDSLEPIIITPPPPLLYPRFFLQTLILARYPLLTLPTRFMTKTCDIAASWM